MTVWAVRVSVAVPVPAPSRANGSLRNAGPPAGWSARRIAPWSQLDVTSPTTGASLDAVLRTTTRSVSGQNAAIRSPPATRTKEGAPGRRNQLGGRSSPDRPRARRSITRPACSWCAAKVASGSTGTGRRSMAQPSVRAAARSVAETRPVTVGGRRAGVPLIHKSAAEFHTALTRLPWRRGIIPLGRETASQPNERRGPQPVWLVRPGREQPARLGRLVRGVVRNLLDRHPAPGHHRRATEPARR